MKVFNYALIILSFLFFSSCSKDKPPLEVANQNKITKEDILKICYSSEFSTTTEVNGIEFEKLLAEFLSPSELEQILIDFVK